MTDQLISSRSYFVMMPAIAKTAKGISATVYVLMPVTVSIIHRRMVTTRVTITRVVRRPRFISPSIWSSMVFWENGNTFLRIIQAIRIRTITSGTMNSIH